MSNAYRLSKTNGGSDKYGPCELCKKDVNSTYILTAFKRYFSVIKKRESLIHVSMSFGHKQCLSNLTVNQHDHI